VTAETTGAGGVKRTGTIDGMRTEVHRQATPTLAPPFGPGVWYAGNGPSNTSLHRRTILAVNGRARIAQRFAIDWLKFGDNGLPYRGDPKQNASWFGYGEDVLAAADGTVTAVKDGIVENVPLSKPAVPITLETVAGNHVIVEHGRGRFALYAHLQPGSLRAKVGDRVRRGQVLGRLGNSGNSDAPHLHFHLCDANSALGCEGVPYTFEQMDVLGTFELSDDLATLEPWSPVPGAAGSARLRELPLENQIVQFAPAAPRP
jgi:murein DD-endopeptidase MepM/ murein hydrolase activator NlpD